MTIHLPEDVENSILAEVHSGHFASMNDALARGMAVFPESQQEMPKTGPGTVAAITRPLARLDERPCRIDGPDR